MDLKMDTKRLAQERLDYMFKSLSFFIYLFYFFILGHKLKIQLQEICSSVVNCFKFNSEHNCVDLYEYVKKENLHLHIE